MSTALATLPQSSDPGAWSPEERALVEAAGLVHTDAQSGTKTLAERPVVAAFLQHCARTGLDPIARQIYSIARKSKGQLKWQIQISIDGARLVAERSGQYEGQTTPEFTADGITWTQVWLSKEFPKAARVGVYRRGFREPLYAVALWDAYVQTKYNGDVSEMWSKMGPLMLAKCAEMLALRKAFPQDLSGLYSAEEMDQASPSSAPVSEPQASVQPPAPEVRQPSRDWLADANAAKSREQLRPVFQAAQEAGDLDVAIADGRSLKEYLWGLRESLPETVEDIVDAEVVEDAPAEQTADWPVADIPKDDEA
ncbi:phage recombination protein Bet [uncultured Microbacterium sp.]|uniref:phage recombination protein Bet n=1 Tax=uncultured Microbacterium sp. TaxID=191216 RepID=UPI0025FC352B|nr:phage recombination protein Bet [uncultured Microbacterium sp.]